MNLHTLLLQREAEHRPIRIALIGAGKFGSMFLASARRTPGLQLVGIADLSHARIKEALTRTAWPSEQIGAKSVSDALTSGKVWLTEDAAALIKTPEIDVVIEATGVPAAGIEHALSAIDAQHHLIMVNVEADALVGPLLAAKAHAAGVVYSLAYGDQPALICEQVDWARAIGLEVIAAGKGTKYLPHYHTSTPDTVWDYYGFSAEQVIKGDFNPKMFNSFLDGTKSAIEMAAVANATGLTPQEEGLHFPAVSVDDLPSILCPQSSGGALSRRGTVEVISSLHRDGTAVARDLRWGVYVTFATRDDYVQRCFAEYGVITDPSGEFAALYRPSHLIGLELGVSVASAALRGEPTGAPRQFVADVGAVAKRPLRAGERLDGEGGYCVYGRLLPSTLSLQCQALPIALADGVTLVRDIPAGALITWQDVALDMNATAVRLRLEMINTA